MTWKHTSILLVALACMTWPTACSNVRHGYFDTVSGYLTLKKGETFVAPMDLFLATEATVRKKDDQILELQRVNKVLIRENEYLKGRP